MLNPLPESTYLKRTHPDTEDIRGAYFRDQTAIIHSLPFRRLKHKTQVFYAPENDHICTRIEHVMHVATIAKTICKGLNAQGWQLNDELAFAIGLGHDLGHAPFGHDGEKILNQLSYPQTFMHEINSYRVVEYLTNNGLGLNLTFAVKDGIICHNGEKFEHYLSPEPQYKNPEFIKTRDHLPSTFEGCIVRYADKIAYLGRDIEDAVTAGFIKLTDLPTSVTKITGNTNSTIINTFVNDIITNSIRENKIGLSNNLYAIMRQLRNFNYQKIYCNPERNAFPYADKILTALHTHLTEIFNKNTLNFEQYKHENLKLNRHFGLHLENMKFFYTHPDDTKQAIIDFLSGMTDLYAIDSIKQLYISIPIV